MEKQNNSSLILNCLQLIYFLANISSHSHLPSAPPLTTSSTPPPPSRPRHRAISSCAFRQPVCSSPPPMAMQDHTSSLPLSDATRRRDSSSNQITSLMPSDVRVFVRNKLGHSWYSFIDLNTHKFPSHIRPVRAELANAKLPSITTHTHRTYIIYIRVSYRGRGALGFPPPRISWNKLIIFTT